MEVENDDFCSVFKQERSACGGWWLVTKRPYMRWSGLADVENDVFDSVLKQERLM